MGNVLDRQGLPGCYEAQIDAASDSLGSAIGGAQRIRTLYRSVDHGGEGVARL